MVPEELDLLEIEQILENYPDTYNFLMSLQNNLAEMGDYEIWSIGKNRQKSCFYFCCYEWIDHDYAGHFFDHDLG